METVTSDNNDKRFPCCRECIYSDNEWWDNTHHRVCRFNPPIHTEDGWEHPEIYDWEGNWCHNFKRFIYQGDVPVLTENYEEARKRADFD